MVGGCDDAEVLLVVPERHHQPAVGGQLLDERTWRADGRGFQQDAVVRGVLREAVGTVPAVDEDAVVAGTGEVLAGVVDDPAGDVDGVDVALADDFGDDGRSVADAGADDEHGITSLGGEGLQ